MTSHSLSPTHQNSLACLSLIFTTLSIEEVCENHSHRSSGKMMDMPEADPFKFVEMENITWQTLLLDRIQYMWQAIKSFNMNFF